MVGGGVGIGDGGISVILASPARLLLTISDVYTLNTFMGTGVLEIHSFIYSHLYNTP